MAELGEFRCAFFARDYEASLAFYGDVLRFEPIASWDRGADDRGTLFRAARGIIEVLALPAERDPQPMWDERKPAGVTVVIEVEDVDRLHARAVERKIAVREGLRRQTWGHRSFVLEDPDGLSLYLFSKIV